MKKVATQYLLLTVFVVGVISTFSLLENPPQRESSSALGASTSSNSAALQELSADGVDQTREPASINPQALYPVEIVNWDCHQDKMVLNAATQVRLRFHPCQKFGHIDSSAELSTQVTNTTTGFAATVFRAGGQSDLTTDFITLAGGVNHIHIEHTLKSGKHLTNELAIVSQ